jgi:hypothetical protein
MRFGAGCRDAIFRDAVLKERHHGTHMFGSSEVAMNNHPYVKRNNTFPAGAKRRKGMARWSLLERDWSPLPLGD